MQTPWQVQNGDLEKLSWRPGCGRSRRGSLASPAATAWAAEQCHALLTEPLAHAVSWEVPPCQGVRAQASRSLTGCQIQDIGCQFQDIGCQFQDIGCKIQGLGSAGLRARPTSAQSWEPYLQHP